MFSASVSKYNHKTHLLLANKVITYFLLASMLLSSCGGIGARSESNIAPTNSGQENLIATEIASTSQSHFNANENEYTPPEYTRPTPLTGEELTTTNEDDKTSTTMQTSGQTSLMFIENNGQFDDRARFKLSGQQGDMYLQDDSIWLSLVDAAALEEISSKSTESIKEGDNTESISPVVTATPTPPAQKPINGVNIQLSFEDANSRVTLEGFNPPETKVSYFIGNNPDDWYTDVPVWGGVRYKDLYPGYDLEMTSKNGVWMWNLVQGKNATPSETTNLRLRIEGAEKLSLDGNAIKITTEAGEVKLPIPVLQQSSEITSQTNKSLRVGAYLDGYEVVVPIAASTSDLEELPETTETPISMNSNQSTRKSRSMVQFGKSESLNGMSLSQLDMEDLFYSTYLGNGVGQGISVDSAGNTYITGYTTSTTFPTTPGVFQSSLAGYFDVFITKLNADGTGAIYSTYLGGVNWIWAVTSLWMEVEQLTSLAPHCHPIFPQQLVHIIKSMLPVQSLLLSLMLMALR